MGLLLLPAAAFATFAAFAESNRRRRGVPDLALGRFGQRKWVHVHPYPWSGAVHED